jgi:hypothetical protein
MYGTTRRMKFTLMILRLKSFQSRIRTGGKPTNKMILYGNEKPGWHPGFSFLV